MLRPAHLASLFLVATCAFAQPSSARHQILEIYRGYASRTLPAKDIVSFWEGAKSNPAPYVAALRVELADRKNSPALLLNGSSRLLYLSDTPFDRRLVMTTLEHFDTRRLGREADIMDYFGVVWTLGHKNENITWAAFRLLAFPNVSIGMWPGIFIREEEILAYLVASTDLDYWLNETVERLSYEPDPTAQKTLLNLLWLAQDDFADRELAAFAKDPKKPLASRQYAEELLARQGSFSSLDRSEIQASSEDQLRARARETIKLYSVNGFTALKKATLKLAAKRQSSPKQ